MSLPQMSEAAKGLKCRDCGVHWLEHKGHDFVDPTQCRRCGARGGWHREGCLPVSQEGKP